MWGEHGSTGLRQKQAKHVFCAFTQSVTMCSTRMSYTAFYRGKRRVSQLSRRTNFFVRRWLSHNTPRYLVSTIHSTPPRQPQNTCPSCLEGVDHLEALSRNKGPHLDRLTLVFLLEKPPRRRDRCLRATLMRACVSGVPVYQSAARLVGCGFSVKF